MTIAYAPTSFQSGKVEPYITLNELMGSATAQAVDFSHLIAGGDTDAQTAAAQRIIWQASAIADLYTLGRSGNTVGTLNATVNKEQGSYRPNRRGQLVIHPAFIPIIGVSAVSYGQGSSLDVLVPLTQESIFFDEEQFIVTQWGPSGVQFGNLSQVLGGSGSRPLVFVQYTYINGFANSFTTEDIDALDSEVTVTDPTGMRPGQPMMLWDTGLDEQVFINDNYDGVSATIPFASPCVNAHVSGTNFSAIPTAVKQAVFHLCAAIVKERGQSGVLLQTMGGGGHMVSSKEEASNDDYMDAFDLLDEFRPTWGKL